jgi:catechol 2,3-dioxygenase-like lactoylglutathione lyase family enzyme
MKTHVSLPTSDLERSVAFYATLLGKPPAKRHDDYALFVTEEPPLELALTLGAPLVDGLTHYGFAVDSAATVEAQMDRLRSAGLPMDVEEETTCCYAVQTKVWATDPDGRRWETYVVLEESEQRDGDAECCSRAPEPALAGAPCC